MTLSETVRQTHRRLSEVNLRFLERALGDPAFSRRESFRALDRQDYIFRYPVQSWPTFIDPSLSAEMAAVSLGLCRLVKSVPRRFFGLDPARLASFYGLEPERARFLSRILGDQDYVDSLLARGDFILADSGFQCLEINICSNLGGLQSSLLARAYPRIPLFEGFVRDHGLSVETPRTVERMFQHLVREAEKRSLSDDELHLAILVKPGDMAGCLPIAGVIEGELQAALRQAGGTRTGTAAFCLNHQLQERGSRLTLDGRRVHVVLELSAERAGPHVLRCWQEGHVVLLNGPLGREVLSSDKRNLALLSEHQGSDLFDPEEQALIRAHVPWTRIVQPGSCRFNGREVDLAELLSAERERFILKPANSSAGQGVCIGDRTSPEAWRACLLGALEGERPWVVQERVPPEVHVYQHGEDDHALHEVTWGLMTYGATYAGGYLRMLPAGGDGVVNSGQGAADGILFEVTGAGAS